jgi:hypothetical protein
MTDREKIRKALEEYDGLRSSLVAEELNRAQSHMVDMLDKLKDVCELLIGEN